ncbi:JDVT-CTERM system glutamic-type intramembrane protease [Salinispirillum sp. LH 10-3-1]|uniref:JDVT-CTERM system glutamic-type intramembrane protease n=1 Tax=Salinispirillum sp. LH 10-3-1 TaxID=2952525 RepID=A0AB38YFB7_9GAMM
MAEETLNPRWSVRAVITDPWLYVALSLALPALFVMQLLQAPDALAGGSDWRHVLLLVLIFPVLEELCFRGWIQPTLSEWLPHRWGPLTLASLLTSVLFAAAHTVHLPLAAAVLVFFPSLVFGGLRDRHHRVLGATLVHSAYNAVFVLIFF